MARERNKQIKFWLTEEEYDLLRQAITRGGYDGLADLVMHCIDKDYVSRRIQRQRDALARVQALCESKSKDMSYAEVIALMCNQKGTDS